MADIRVDLASPDDRTIWDAFVLSNPHAGVGHLWGVAELEKVTSRSNPRMLMARNSEGNLCGVCPLFLTRETRLRSVVVRNLVSGTHFPSGPLVDSNLSDRQRTEVLEAIVTRILEIGRLDGVDFIAIGYPGVVGGRPFVDQVGYYPLRHYGFMDRSRPGLLADLRPEPETIFRSFRHKCRKNIRRSEKAGASYRILEQKDDWIECHPLCEQTLGPGVWTKQAFSVLWDELVVHGYAIAGVVEHDGQIASANVATSFKQAAYRWLLFNQQPPVLTGGSNLAGWRIMLACKAAGCDVCEIGSLEFEDKKQMGISRWKESFGGRSYYGLSGVYSCRPAKDAAITLLEISARRLVHRLRSIRRPGR